MPIISYEKFLEIFNLPLYAEYEFYFSDTDETYMLIKYEDKISFQRCGYGNHGSGEFYYQNFEELYISNTVDDICLKDIWEKIKVIIVDTIFEIPEDIDDIIAMYKHK